MYSSSYQTPIRHQSAASAQPTFQSPSYSVSQSQPQPVTNPSTALMAQQSRNNNPAAQASDVPVLSSLMNAAQFIERELSYDERNTDPYASGDSRETGAYYYDTDKLILAKQFSLPESILNQYNAVECQSFVGFLPAIHRAYLTIDNQLFLWDYETGQDFYEFSGLKQIILSLVIVRPKSSVFDSGNYQSLLVITTPIEIVLLGVTFANTGNYHSPLTLLQLDGYTVSSNNVPMVAIASTNTGRILLGGNDGHLYELDYYGHSTVWHGKMKLVKYSHGFNPLQSLASLVWTQAPDAIKSIIVDESRAPSLFVYTLTSRSSVTAWTLSNSNDNQSKLQCLNHLTNIYDESKKLLFSLHPNYTEDWNNPNEFAITAIHCIAKYESERVALMALTNHGHRIYFTLESSYGQSLSLKVKFIRLSPPGARPPASVSGNIGMGDDSPSTAMTGPMYSYDPAYKRGSSPYFVHASHYCDGVLILADSIPDGGDTVIGCQRDEILSTNKLIELIDSTIIPTKIAEFCESDRFEASSSLATLFFARGQPQPLIGLKEMTVQHAVPARSFLSLSSNGLYVFVKQRAIDDLREAIVRRQQTLDDSPTNALIQRYGVKETGAMILVLACAAPTLLSLGDGTSMTTMSPTKFSFNDDQLIKQARQTFLRISQSQWSQPATVTQSSAVSALTPYVPTVQLAHSVQSVTLFASRLLRPLWDWPLMSRSAATSSLSLRYTNAQLTELIGWIDRLVSFIDEYSRILARTVEESSTLTDTQTLLSLTLELLSFLQLLSFQSVSFFTSLLMTLEDSDRQLLSSMKFYELMTTRHGFLLVKRLMHSVTKVPLPSSSSTPGVPIIGSVNGLNDSEQWVLRLHRACPAFFAQSDLLYYQANEAVKRSQTTMGQQRLAMIEEASNAYKIAARAPTFDAREVAATLVNAGAFTAAVEIALYRAESVRRGEIQPLTSLTNQPVRSDRDEQQTFVRQEMQKCFSIIIDILHFLASPQSSQSFSLLSLPLPVLDDIDTNTERSRVLSQCFQYDNYDFHTVFYQYLIDSDQKELLFVSGSAASVSHLIAFLTGNEKYILLLNDYYLRQEMHAQATLLLFSLATRESELWTLNDRIGFIARALACARNCIERHSTITGSVDDDSELVHQLRHNIELAKLQAQLQSTILNTVSNNNLVSSGETQQSLIELDRRLLDENALYQLAYQNQCWTICLALFYVSEERGRDDVIAPLWQNLIRQEIQNAYQLGQSWAQNVVMKLKELVGQYQPVPWMFPLSAIVTELENDVARFGIDSNAVIVDSEFKSDDSADTDTVGGWLLVCGVDTTRLMAVYDRAIDANTLTQENELTIIHSVIHLLQHAARLRKYSGGGGGGGGGGDDSLLLTARGLFLKTRAHLHGAPHIDPIVSQRLAALQASLNVAE